jgi:hypothetical protein
MMNNMMRDREARVAAISVRSINWRHSGIRRKA